MRNGQVTPTMLPGNGINSRHALFPFVQASAHLFLHLVAEEVLVGTEIPQGGKKNRLHLTIHCNYQTDSCIIRWAAMRHLNV